MAKVYIPAGLRAVASGQTSVTAAGDTLAAVIDSLERAHPGIRARLVSADEPDRLRPGLAAFIDGVQAGAGLRTRLTDESEVYFVPAVAGGRTRHKA